jgi:tetratricopeptide (TPR) repeat protein
LINWYLSGDELAHCWNISEKGGRAMANVRLIILLALCLRLADGASAQQAKWEEMNQQAEKLYQQGKYAEASSMLERAVDAAEKNFGSGHLNVALTLIYLGKSYREQDRYSEAEPILRRSLVIVESSVTGDHPAVATPLIGLARVYQFQGRYSEAEPLYKRGLAIKEKAGGTPNQAVRSYRLRLHRGDVCGFMVEEGPTTSTSPGKMTSESNWVRYAREKDEFRVEQAFQSYFASVQ